MKRSVLVIDDDRDLCEVISRALKKEGFDVDCAFSLAQANEKLSTHPGIIFLDNNLPDGTGLEYIKMYPVYFMESYVIMISADPGLAVQKNTFHERVIDFLPKPFSIDRLKKIIASLAFI